MSFRFYRKKTASREKHSGGGFKLLGSFTSKQIHHKLKLLDSSDWMSRTEM